jgi:hypothetical protein
MKKKYAREKPEVKTSKIQPVEKPPGPPKKDARRPFGAV